MRCILYSALHLLSLIVFAGVLGPAATAFGQTQTTSQRDDVDGQGTVGSPDVSGKPNNSAPDPGGSAVPTLLIGPGDELQITIYGAADLSQTTRVNADGNIFIPEIGYAHISGLTSDQAERVIGNRLRQSKVLNDPQVTVYVKAYTNSGISVVGEVKTPGVYSALGPHRLFDILQAAGGPTEKAGYTATVTHRDQTKVTTLLLSPDPTTMAQSNIDLMPGDTLVIPRAGIVYVLGEVNKPGGYVLNSTGGITVLQVVAAAGGPTHLASVGGTKLVRRTTSGGLEEQPVPLKQLLHAKARDIPVRADDILYIPSSRIKEAFNATSLLSTLGTSAIYRVPF